jgi:ATP-binding cassette subfamily F protein uup
MEMRRQRKERRELTGTVKMDVQKAEASGKLVVVAEDVSFGYESREVIRDFSTTCARRQGRR